MENPDNRPPNQGIKESMEDFLENWMKGGATAQALGFGLVTAMVFNIMRFFFNLVAAVLVPTLDAFVRVLGLRPTRNLYTPRVHLFINVVAVVLVIEGYVEGRAWYNLFLVLWGSTVAALLGGVFVGTIIALIDAAMFKLDTLGMRWRMLIVVGTLRLVLLMGMPLVTFVPVGMNTYQPEINAVITAREDEQIKPRKEAEVERLRVEMQELIKKQEEADAQARVGKNGAWDREHETHVTTQKEKQAALERQADKSNRAISDAALFGSNFEGGVKTGAQALAEAQAASEAAEREWAREFADRRKADLDAFEREAEGRVAAIRKAKEDEVKVVQGLTRDQFAERFDRSWQEPRTYGNLQSAFFQLWTLRPDLQQGIISLIGIMSVMGLLVLLLKVLGGKEVQNFYSSVAQANAGEEEAQRNIAGGHAVEIQDLLKQWSGIYGDLLEGVVALRNSLEGSIQPGLSDEQYEALVRKGWLRYVGVHVAAMATLEHKLSLLYQAPPAWPTNAPYPDPRGDHNRWPDAYEVLLPPLPGAMEEVQPERAVG